MSREDAIIARFEAAQVKMDQARNAKAEMEEMMERYTLGDGRVAHVWL